MKIGLIVNLQKPLAKKVVLELISYCKQQGITPMLEESAAACLKQIKYASKQKDLVSVAQLLIALGGDGTLLKTARLVGSKEKPVMGINLGGLGFLTMFSAEQARSAVADFLNKNYREEERMVLEIAYKKEKFSALNDCAINMGSDCRVVDLILSSNNNFICKLVADGVVVATPTGSTAYSLAAGGPIVFPTMEAILITPLSPHVLSGRPLIVPSSESISLQLAECSEPAVLTIDGQEQRRLKPGDKISITKADYSMRLIAPKGKSYYEILRTKMKWSERGQ
ncbi:MAG: NAD(+)/NADH kinase [Desulfobulbaceae bacterium]|nr:NAD(+)/NADH kinase [Desulfobulbaceae bacterium]